MRTIATLLGRILKWAVVSVGALLLIAIVGGFFLARALVEPDSSKFGAIPDEAKAAGLTREALSLVAKCRERPADCSYFALMDKGLLVKPADGAAYPKEILQVAQLTKMEPEQVRESALRGQVAWIAWTGGNDRFWD